MFGHGNRSTITISILYFVFCTLYKELHHNIEVNIGVTMMINCSDHITICNDKGPIQVHTEIEYHV